jgi:hypothetical protein
MKAVFPSRLLKFALWADAVATGLLAGPQLARPDWLSHITQLPRALIVETGAFMVAYAALLLVLAQCARLWSLPVALIAIGNVGWAAGAVALAAFDLVSPNSFGLALLAVHALGVLPLAALQWKGLADSDPAAGGASTGLRS